MSMYNNFIIDLINNVCKYFMLYYYIILHCTNDSSIINESNFTLIDEFNVTIKFFYLHLFYN